jgi:hypothetical protein
MKNFKAYFLFSFFVVIGIVFNSCQEVFYSKTINMRVVLRGEVYDMKATVSQSDSLYSFQSEDGVGISTSISFPRKSQDAYSINYNDNNLQFSFLNTNGSINDWEWTEYLIDQKYWNPINVLIEGYGEKSPTGVFTAFVYKYHDFDPFNTNEHSNFTELIVFFSEDEITRTTVTESGNNNAFVPNDVPKGEIIDISLRDEAILGDWVVKDNKSYSYGCNGVKREYESGGGKTHRFTNEVVESSWYRGYRAIYDPEVGESELLDTWTWGGNDLKDEIYLSSVNFAYGSAVGWSISKFTENELTLYTLLPLHGCRQLNHLTFVKKQ